MNILLGREEVVPTSQIMTAEHCSRIPLRISMKFCLLVELRTFSVPADMRFGLGGSAPPGQVVLAEYRSRMLLRVEARK